MVRFSLLGQPFHPLRIANALLTLLFCFKEQNKRALPHFYRNPYRRAS